MERDGAVASGGWGWGAEACGWVAGWVRAWCRGAGAAAGGFEERGVESMAVGGVTWLLQVLKAVRLFVTHERGQTAEVKNEVEDKSQQQQEQ